MPAFRPHKLVLPACCLLVATGLAGCAAKSTASEVPVAPPEAALLKSVGEMPAQGDISRQSRFTRPEYGEFNLHKRHGLGGWTRPASSDAEDVR